MRVRFCLVVTEAGGMRGIDNVAGGKQGNRGDPPSGAASLESIAYIRDPKTRRDAYCIQSASAAYGGRHGLASAGPAIPNLRCVRDR